jgi:hypothetical protein
MIFLATYRPLCQYLPVLCMAFANLSVVLHLANLYRLPNINGGTGFR